MSYLLVTVIAAASSAVNWCGCDDDGDDVNKVTTKNNKPFNYLRYDRKCYYSTAHTYTHIPITRYITFTDGV